MSSTPQQQHGYDPDLFIDKIEKDLQCPLCLCVVRTALMLPEGCDCGLVYCRGCLERLPVPRQCPQCRSPFDLHHCTAQKFVDQRVQRMQVKCCYVEEGCPVTFILGKDGKNYSAHQKECSFGQTTCPDCKIEIKRKELEIHRKEICEARLVNCEGCQELYPVKLLKQHQDNEFKCDKLTKCSAYPHCDRIIFKKDAKNHSVQCEFQEVSCSYSYYGCPWVGQRRLLLAHEKEGAGVHLAYTINKVHTLESVVVDMKKQYDKQLADMKSAINQLQEKNQEKKKGVFYFDPHRKSDSIEIHGTTVTSSGSGTQYCLLSPALTEGAWELNLVLSKGNDFYHDVCLVSALFDPNSSISSDDNKHLIALTGGGVKDPMTMTIKIDCNTKKVWLNQQSSRSFDRIGVPVYIAIELYRSGAKFELLGGRRLS